MYRHSACIHSSTFYCYTERCCAVRRYAERRYAYRRGAILCDICRASCQHIYKKVSHFQVKLNKSRDIKLLLRSCALQVDPASGKSV